MKIINFFPAILIAFQINSSFSAPISARLGLDSVKRESPTFAVGNCTSQSVAGKSMIDSRNCPQGDSAGSYTSGDVPTLVDSGRATTTNGGGSTISGLSTTDSGRGTTDSWRGSTDGGRGTTDSGRGTTDNSRGTTDSSRGTTDSSRGTTDSARGTIGTGGVSATSGNAASPLLNKVINGLKAEGSGNADLPSLTNDISRINPEFQGANDFGPGTGAIAASAYRKRDLDNQAYNSILFANKKDGDMSTQDLETVKRLSGDLQGDSQQVDPQPGEL